MSAGLQGPVVLIVKHILIDGNWAVVELAAKDCIAKAGWCFNNEYCWVCRFSQVGSQNILSNMHVHHDTR